MLSIKGLHSFVMIKFKFGPFNFSHNEKGDKFSYIIFIRKAQTDYVLKGISPMEPPSDIGNKLSVSGYRLLR